MLDLQADRPSQSIWRFPYLQLYGGSKTLCCNIPLDDDFHLWLLKTCLWENAPRKPNQDIAYRQYIGIENFIGNMSFLYKTERACAPSTSFRKNCRGYSKVLDYAQMKLASLSILQKLYPLLSLPIKARLTGNKPSIFWFNIYKLLYYIHLD